MLNEEEKYYELGFKFIVGCDEAGRGPLCGPVVAAACILPLTPNTGLSSQLGTRHRAAIGMTENSDAIVLVVSEETGTISIAFNGSITRDHSVASAYTEIKSKLIDIYEEDSEPFVKTFVKKIIALKKPKNKDLSAKEEENDEV